MTRRFKLDSVAPVATLDVDDEAAQLDRTLIPLVHRQELQGRDHTLSGWLINAVQITSGTINPARLGSGTPSASTVLLGNSTWGSVPFGSISLSASPRVLGRTTAGAGAAEELSVTGTGSIVMSTSPAITTPSLSVPVIGDFTSATHDHSNAAGGGNLTSSAFATGSITSLQLAGIISDETGSGALVFANTPTLTTPTIASFANANHNHQSSAGGGTLDAAAITAGTLATARLGSGSATSATFLRGDSTWSSTLVGSFTASGASSDISAGRDVSAVRYVTGQGVYAIGAADEVQMIARANGTQTAAVWQVQNSSAVAVAQCDKNGALISSSFVSLTSVNVQGLTASQAVFTDGSKNLTSNAITGSGNVVMSTTPTIATPDITTSLGVQSNSTVNTNKSGSIFGTRYSQTTARDVSLISYSAFSTLTEMFVGGAKCMHVWFAASDTLTGSGRITMHMTPAGLLIEQDTGNTADASAILELKSTTQGFLPPRMDSTARTSISSPAVGLIVFDTTTDSLWVFNSGSGWKEIAML